MTARWMDLWGVVAIALWLFAVFHLLMMLIRYFAALGNGQLRFTLMGLWAKDMPNEIRVHRKWAMIGMAAFAALIISTLQISN
jgi:hypothetical protein